MFFLDLDCAMFGDNIMVVSDVENRRSDGNVVWV